MVNTYLLCLREEREHLLCFGPYCARLVNHDHHLILVRFRPNLVSHRSRRGSLGVTVYLSARALCETL